MRVDTHHRAGNRGSDRHHVALLDAIIVFGCAAAYLSNQLYLGPVIGGSFLRGHFNDVVAAIALVAFSDALVAMSPFRLALFRRVWPAIALTCFAAAFWELVVPEYRASVPDWNDVASYFAGTATYLIAVRCW
jgi:hypothetical protein